MEEFQWERCLEVPAADKGLKLRGHRANSRERILSAASEECSATFINAPNKRVLMIAGLAARGARRATSSSSASFSYVLPLPTFPPPLAFLPWPRSPFETSSRVRAFYGVYLGFCYSEPSVVWTVDRAAGFLNILPACRDAFYCPDYFERTPPRAGAERRTAVLRLSGRLWSLTLLRNLYRPRISAATLLRRCS